MKTKQLITLLMATLLAIIPVFAQKANPNRITIVFNVAMDCNKCQQKIEKYMAFERGVRDIKTNLEKQTVEITYDIRQNSVEKLQEAFKKINYEAKLVKPDKKSD